VKELEKHPSYGMVGFSRITHGGARGGTNLFGSSLTHSHTIALRIKRATKGRHGSDDWYYGGETLIEVEMSPAQFAEAITTLNVGDGIPCTIRRIGDQGVENCPEVSMRQRFENEFNDTCTHVSDLAADMIKKVEGMLTQKTIKVSERKELLETLRMLSMNLKSNLPFINSQFNEAMDKVVADAKSSVEAAITHRISDLGIKTFNELGSAGEAPIIQIECSKPG
jgi:hypothetical protein